jgi:hypothetical protein
VTDDDRRRAIDLRVAEARRLLGEHLTVVEPGPHFAARVAARLPRSSGGMLTWAAHRVLPISLALAAVLTIAVFLNRGSADPGIEAASLSSTSQRTADPLDWLLESPGVR